MITTNRMEKLRRQIEEEHEHRFGRDSDERYPVWYVLLHVAFFVLMYYLFSQLGHV